jgi:integrase/recombinase XerD
VDHHQPQARQTVRSPTEAIQAQAGHASIESTRIYLHLANDWLAGQYLRAAEAIEAQATASAAAAVAE